MLDSLTSQLRKKGLSILCEICGRQTLSPRSFRISVRYDAATPLYSSGDANVWVGMHKGRKVAVKVLVTHWTSKLWQKFTEVGYHQ